MPQGSHNARVRRYAMREKDSNEDGIGDSPQADPGIQQMQQSIENREDQDSRRNTDCLLQVLEWIAAKHQLFGQRTAQQRQDHRNQIGDKMPAS